MGETSSNKQPTRSFNDHPIVSTVLWILGHHVKKQNPPPQENKASMLSWKDDHGGHIAEYIMEVQAKTGSDSCTITTEKTGEVSSESQQLGIKRHTKSWMPPPGTGAGEESPALPSPQWGFYVPITPPEQEMYAKSQFCR